MKHAALILALVLTAGCKGVRRDKDAPRKAGAEKASQALPAASADEEASLRDKHYAAVPELGAVRFPYDSAWLDEVARARLRKNVEWLKANPKIEVRIAGHCDERGTVEYNLALGQRRATAVRDYYKALGIKLKRMATISYGEERPDCSEATDDCWARNRRAETMVRRS